jgi:hypothetical protein
MFGSHIQEPPYVQRRMTANIHLDVSDAHQHSRRGKTIYASSVLEPTFVQRRVSRSIHLHDVANANYRSRRGKFNTVEDDTPIPARTRAVRRSYAEYSTYTYRPASTVRFGVPVEDPLNPNVVRRKPTRVVPFPQPGSLRRLGLKIIQADDLPIQKSRGQYPHYPHDFTNPRRSPIPPTGQDYGPVVLPNRVRLYSFPAIPGYYRRRWHFNTGEEILRRQRARMARPLNEPPYTGQTTRGRVPPSGLTEEPIAPERNIAREVVDPPYITGASRRINPQLFEGDANPVLLSRKLRGEDPPPMIFNTRRATPTYFEEESPVPSRRPLAHVPPEVFSPVTITTTWAPTLIDDPTTIFARPHAQTPTLPPQALLGGTTTRKSYPTDSRQAFPSRKSKPSEVFNFPAYVRSYSRKTEVFVSVGDGLLHRRPRYVPDHYYPLLRNLLARHGYLTLDADVSARSRRSAPSIPGFIPTVLLVRVPQRTPIIDDANLPLQRIVPLPTIPQFAPHRGTYLRHPVPGLGETDNPVIPGTRTYLSWIPEGITVLPPGSFRRRSMIPVYYTPPEDGDPAFGIIGLECTIEDLGCGFSPWYEHGSQH